MPWARIDDGFDENAKIESLLDEEDPTLALAALGLWLLGLTRAHREMQGSRRRKATVPGLIQRSNIRRYTSRENREEIAGLLVKYNLWEIHEDGWIIHDFTEYLPSAKTREERSKAGKKGAQVKWAKSGTDGKVPTGDGKVPPDDKQAASDMLANDGSRARTPVGQDLSRTRTREEPSSGPSSRGTDIRPASQGVIPGTGTEDEAVDNRQPGQRLIGYWCDLVAPMRPHKSTLGAAGKFLAESVKDGNVPEELLRECIDEFVASGKSGINILRNIVDSRINKSAGHTRRDRARCPDHESYFQDNCPYH